MYAEESFHKTFKFGVFPESNCLVAALKDDIWAKDPYPEPPRKNIYKKRKIQVKLN